MDSKKPIEVEEKKDIVVVDQDSDLEIIDSATPLFLGGGRTISAVYGGAGNKTVIGFNIELKTPTGRVLKSYPVSLEDGRSLIHTAVTQMASSSTTNMMLVDEVEQSIMPVKVAIQYVAELKKLGVPSEQLPKTVGEAFERIDRELGAYLKVGEVQISLRSQQVQDSLISLVLQVFNGNNAAYDGLPKAMKEKVDYLLHIITVMAVEKSGFSAKTVETHRQIVAMKATESEEALARFAANSPKAGQAAGDAIASFLGSVFGGTAGSIASAFKRNKDKEE